MALTPVRILAFQQYRPIVDNEGRPSREFLQGLNSAFAQLQNAQNATNAALEAAGLANAAAAAANAAAEAVTSESSLVNSFVLGGSFAGNSPLEADSAGNVTIKAHTRRYGDPTLNPDVVLVGAVLATGEANPDIVRIFYVDATRADTTPTFQFTTDPAIEPTQGGDTHVVGAVEIPAAGTSDGGYVKPPGYTGVTP